MKFLRLFVMVAFIVSTGESFTEVDSKWMLNQEFDSLVRIDCVGKPRLVKIANFSSINQFKPLVIKSPESDTHASYNRYEKCKANFFVPSMASVYLYFHKFDVAIELDGCGDNLRVTHGQDDGYVFVGSQWEGKLLRLDAKPAHSWLSFSFSANGNQKVGKGFEIYFFGKYDIIPGLTSTLATTTSGGTHTEAEPNNGTTSTMTALISMQTTTMSNSTQGTTTAATTTIATTTGATTTAATITIATTTGATTTAATTTTKPPLYKLGKLLVATGSQPTAIQTEVIDLSNPNNLCKAYPSHPQEISGATAQILGNQVVICGGSIKGVGPSNKCTILGQSSPYVTLKKNRYLLGSIPLNATHMMLAGGSGSPNSESSTEIVSISGSSVYGPNMPMPLYGHCFIRINDEKAMIISGFTVQSSTVTVSARVWSLDLATFAWTELPSLNTGRISHGCGSFTVNNKAYAITSGGTLSNGLRLSTTEILDVQSGQSWVNGPSLPLGMSYLQMVTNPQGNGVVIMSGISEKGLHGDLHELVCDGITCKNWKKLPMTLSVPRSLFVALNVPDEFC